MPPLQVAALPADTILDSGVLYLNSNTPYGVSRGEPSVQLNHAFENTEFDGKLAPIAGLDRPMPSSAPRISGKFIELNATKAGDLEPGGSASTVGAVTTVTPAPLGDYLDPTTGYKTNVRLAFRRGSGGVAVVIFPKALMWGDQVGGKGEIDLVIEARQPETATALSTPLYSIILADTIATAVLP